MTIGKLTPKQMKAIALLGQGISYSEVARQLGVGQRSVERWMARQDFREAVNEVRAKAVEKLGEEIFERCREGLLRGLPKSITKVLTALDHSDARIQLKAAELVSKWSGFYQPTSQGKQAEVAPNAQQNLKDYLAYLESRNGN